MLTHWMNLFVQPFRCIMTCPYPPAHRSGADSAVCPLKRRLLSRACATAWEEDDDPSEIIRAAEGFWSLWRPSGGQTCRDPSRELSTAESVAWAICHCH